MVTPFWHFHHPFTKATSLFSFQKGSLYCLFFQLSWCPFMPFTSLTIGCSGELCIYKISKVVANFTIYMHVLVTFSFVTQWMDQYAYLDILGEDMPYTGIRNVLHARTIPFNMKIMWQKTLTPTWFEHATFWSGVRRATVAPRSHYWRMQLENSTYTKDAEYFIRNWCVHVLRYLSTRQAEWRSGSVLGP